MRFSEDPGVGGGELAEFLRRLLLQFGPEECVLELFRFGDQRGILGGELVVGGILQLIPSSPDWVLVVQLLR